MPVIISHPLPAIQIYGVPRETATASVGGPVAADPTYRMRAFDSSLARVVFWNASIVDSTGASYGGPGPLVDVVVHMLLGT